MNVYVDACLIGQSKFAAIHGQFGFAFTWASLYRPFGLSPSGLSQFGFICAIALWGIMQTGSSLFL